MERLRDITSTITLNELVEEAVAIAPNKSMPDKPRNKASQQHFPHDVLIRILSWIHPNHVLKFRRLSHLLDSTLTSTHFALLATNHCEIRVPKNNRTMKQSFELGWFNWPNALQSVYTRSLTHLTNISLESCGLTGSLPKPLCSMTQLTSLFLSHNQLTGSIPKEFGQLRKLELCVMASNQLSGPIPNEIGNLGLLQCLNLSDNLLTGVIPTEFKNLQFLLYIYLQNNNLSGEIPHELGTLGCLNELNLSNNNLCGEIPESLGELDYIQEMDLSNNYLEGEIPLSIYLKMEEEGMRLNVLNL
ncbi:hypothetical protein BDR26DRAFT_818889, partial [Obelidium mucronatum]